MSHTVPLFVVSIRINCYQLLKDFITVTSVLQLIILHSYPVYIFRYNSRTTFNILLNYSEVYMKTKIFRINYTRISEMSSFKDGM